MAATKIKFTKPVDFNNQEISQLTIPATTTITESQVTNLETDLSNKQEKLISTTNIKTINNISVLGSGNIDVGVDTLNIENGTGTNSIQQKYEATTFTGIDINGTDTSYTSGANGDYSASFGAKNVVTAKGGFTQGTKTVAAKYGIALGDTTYANDFGIAHGYKSIAGGYYSVALGEQSKTIGDYAVAQGYKTQADDYAHSEGSETVANGQGSHAEGTLSNSQGSASHAEGYSTYSVGAFSHSEGISTYAGSPAGSGWVESVSTSPVTKTINTTGTITVTSAHVSNGFTISTSVDNTNKIITAIISPTPTTSNRALIQIIYSIDGVEPEPGPTPTPTIVEPNLGAHSEGYGTKAYLTASHSEGSMTSAIGECAHSEGYNTSAFGAYSHSEGNNTYVVGDGAHAEGYKTQAIYDYSHSEGYGTKTGAQYQTVVGKFNTIEQSSLFVVGGGSSEDYRATYFKVRTDGCAEVANHPIYNNDVVTKYYADQKLALSGGTMSGDIVLNSNKIYFTTSGQQYIAANQYGTPIVYSGAGNSYKFESFSFYPAVSSSLGTSNNKWSTFYVSGNISDGTNSITVANIANKTDLGTQVTYTFSSGILEITTK